MWFFFRERYFAPVQASGQRQVRDRREPVREISEIPNLAGVSPRVSPVQARCFGGLPTLASTRDHEV